MSAGAKDDEIASLNLSTLADIDLAEYIDKKMNGISNAKPPFVFFYCYYLGDGDSIKKMCEEGSLQKIIVGNITTPYEQVADSPEEEINQTLMNTNQEDKPQLRLIDNILEATEMLTGYINPFAWWRTPAKEDNEPLFSVDVIHTNWYGRNLRRTFKFYPTFYQRVHPNGQVRAMYNYEQISELKHKNPTTLIIEYKENHSPDWIQSSPQDITKISEHLSPLLTSSIHI